MEYEILFDHRVIKEDFKSIGDINKKRIVRDIGNKLRTAPLDFGKPLQYEFKKLHSLRVGDYRVIFYIDQNEQLVTILKIGHRKEVYKELLKRLE
jgi:mRNA interferase RelE/StbE